jgi:hypothetical protein
MMEMSKFYGKIPAWGSARRTDATSRGHNGIVTQAASWDGAVEVRLFLDEEGKTRFRVYQTKWEGHGVEKPIAEGVVGE